MSLKKFGKIVRAAGAAGKDADLARNTSQSKEFRKDLDADRRGTLSEFRTVKHALRDRERIEAAKKAKVIKAKRAK